MNALQKFSIILLLLFLSSGCKSDEILEDYSIDLIRPIETIESYFGVLFEWESLNLNSFNLKLSDNSDFENLILDTLLNSKNLLYEKPLEPNKTYYWKIMSGVFSGISSFKVEDLLNKYEGEVHVSMQKQNWDIDNGITLDTTFEAIIQIAKQDEDLGFIANNSNIDVLVPYDYTNCNSKFLIYRDQGQSSHYTDLRINTENDSINIYHTNGGLGSGSKFYINGKIEL